MTEEPKEPTQQQPEEPQEPTDDGEPKEPTEPTDSGEPKKTTVTIEDIVAGRTPETKKGVDTTPRWAKQRFDELTRKIYDKDQRIKELESKGNVITLPTGRPIPPIENDFVDSQDFLIARIKYEDDLDTWKYQRNQERETQKRQEEESALNAINFDKNANRMRAKYDDFDEALNAPLLTTTNVLNEVIASDYGPEIGYFLAKNPAEALRLSKLPERQITREIAKLEVKFSMADKKMVSNAPKPITPLKGEEEVVQKDPSKMSDDEWYQWDKQQKLKRIQGKT